MAITTSYYSASGASWTNCAFLGQRYEEAYGYKPGEGECWICSVAPGATESMLTLHRGSTGWLTQLWRSAAGSLYVSGASGTVHQRGNPADPGSPWETPKLDAALFGIWGIDDRCVFSWGSRGNTPVFFRWNGTDWKEMPSPAFSVRAVHGLFPDMLYAVGVDGGIASWDGRAWRTLRSPTSEILSSVFVAGADEAYAVGTEGAILEGSAAGWGRIGAGPGLPGPLAAVAKFAGELWIGAGNLGLFKRLGVTDQFVCVKPNIHAVDFDARQELVIASTDLIAGTSDGQKYKGIGKQWLLEMRANHDLCDF